MMNPKLVALTVIVTAILAQASGLPVDQFLNGVNDVPETLIENMGFSYSDNNEGNENSRLVTLDRSNGVETYQTDEDVASTLKMAKSYTSSHLYSSNGVPKDSDQSGKVADKTKRRIIGTDHRYRISYLYTFFHPFCAIGQLSNAYGRGFCTVFLIGPYHAVTAGHCVYNTTTKRYYRNLDVNIGRTCYTKRGIHADVNHVTLFKEFRKKGDNRYDIALLVLDHRDINSTCYFGIGYRDPMPKVNASVCGYPYDKRAIPLGFYKTYDCMYCSNGQAAVPCITLNGTRVYEDRYIIHSCDTIAGMTGGPLMTKEHSRNQVRPIAYGVNSGYLSIFNRATRITKSKFHAICEWLRDRGGVCKITYD